MLKIFKRFIKVSLREGPAPRYGYPRCCKDFFRHGSRISNAQGRMADQRGHRFIHATDGPTLIRKRYVVTAQVLHGEATFLGRFDDEAPVIPIRRGRGEQ